MSENHRNDDPRIEVILSRVEEIAAHVEKISECLNGNGKPGIKVQVDRLNQWRKTIIFIVAPVFVAIAGLVVADLYAKITGRIQPIIGRNNP